MPTVLYNSSNTVQGGLGGHDGGGGGGLQCHRKNKGLKCLKYPDTESADVLTTRGEHIAYGGQPHSSNKHILAAESCTRDLFS